jgi:hypothetical protein
MQGSGSPQSKFHWQPIWTARLYIPTVDNRHQLHVNRTDHIDFQLLTQCLEKPCVQRVCVLFSSILSPKYGLCIFFFFGSTGVWVQGLALAMQVLCYLNHSPAQFVYLLIRFVLQFTQRKSQVEWWKEHRLESQAGESLWTSYHKP